MNLTSFSDEQLISNIQEDVAKNESLEELISRHSGIYFSVVNKYFPDAKVLNSKLNVDVDLVFKSKDYVIYESALSYDKNRGAKFSTHVGNQARYFCLGQINKSGPYLPFEQNEFENIFSEDAAVHDKIDESLASKVIEVIKANPDERVYEIFRLRYLDSYGNKVTPWSKIYKKIPHARSKSKHLTIQGCINLHNKALKDIRKKVRGIKD